MIRPGMPATTQYAGTSLLTSEFALMYVRSPMLAAITVLFDPMTA